MSKLGNSSGDDDSMRQNAGTDHVEDLDEASFEALEDRVEQLATQNQTAPPPSPREAPPDSGPIRSEREFETAVRSAIDDLPDEFQKQLDGVVITVSDDGHKESAYGMFVPGSRRGDGYTWWFFGSGRRASASQIIIYRDTLLRDYGNDPARLRAMITETVRHEVGHALGFDEAGVRRLDL